MLPAKRPRSPSPDDAEEDSSIVSSSSLAQARPAAAEIKNEIGDQYIQTPWSLDDDLDPWTYENTTILAPMVRCGALPLRQLSREFGCDIVYSEETIALKLAKCVRVVEPSTNLIGYVLPKNTGSSPTSPSSDSSMVGSCGVSMKAGATGSQYSYCMRDAGEHGLLDGMTRVFQTYPGERVVVQLGAADAVSALAAASVVARDCRAIDLNMGCPKLFSLQGAMGSALLTKPEVVADILSTLKRNLNIPVTAKIRMLSSPKQTIALAKTIEACGVDALAVHCRFRDDRPRHRALPSLLLPHIVDAVNIPVICNGDVFQWSDIDRIRAASRCSSVMIGRAALWNPSIFGGRVAKTNKQGNTTSSNADSYYIRNTNNNNTVSADSFSSHPAGFVPLFSCARRLRVLDDVLRLQFPIALAPSQSNSVATATTTQPNTCHMDNINDNTNNGSINGNMADVVDSTSNSIDMKEDELNNVPSSYNSNSNVYPWSRSGELYATPTSTCMPDDLNWEWSDEDLFKTRRAVMHKYIEQNMPDMILGKLNKKYNKYWYPHERRSNRAKRENSEGEEDMDGKDDEEGEEEEDDEDSVYIYDSRSDGITRPVLPAVKRLVKISYSVGNNIGITKYTAAEMLKSHFRVTSSIGFKSIALSKTHKELYAAVSKLSDIESVTGEYKTPFIPRMYEKRVIGKEGSNDGYSKEKGKQGRGEGSHERKEKDGGGVDGEVGDSSERESTNINMDNGDNIKLTGRLNKSKKAKLESIIMMKELEKEKEIDQQMNGG